jgi:hypothetical protein
MASLRCPKCGFVQAPREDCVKCGLIFSKWESHQTVSAERKPQPPPPPPDDPAPAAPAPRRFPPAAGLAAGVVAAAALAVFLWNRTAQEGGIKPESETAPNPGQTAPVTMAGVWSGRVTGALPGPPAREITKFVTIESDADGGIRAASVLLTDPVAGSAGAGYRLDPGGSKGFEALIARINGAGEAPDFAPDFVAAPAGDALAPRTWHVIEGYWETPPRGKKPGRPVKTEAIQYVLLESDDSNGLFQIGETRRGFLSYVYFTKDLTAGKSRGVDLISSVIDPPEGSRLHSFSHLVWDLSGSTDFLKMRIEATVSGPEGGPDALLLIKK